MILPPTDIQILQHIYKKCCEIKGTIEYFGKSKRVFLREESYIYRNAISQPIEQIGELAKRLSDEFIRTHTAIPWKGVKGMRDRFAHGYDTMDREEIWNTAVHDIAELERFCKEELTINGFNE